MIDNNAPFIDLLHTWNPRISSKKSEAKALFLFRDYIRPIDGLVRFWCFWAQQTILLSQEVYPSEK
jgi:hypothetical protein